MQKIHIQTGGFPQLGEYLLSLQAGLTDAIKGATSNMPDVLLSGCAITNTAGTNYACTAGYLKWDGEIYAVPAHNFVIGVGQSAVAFKEIIETPVPIEYFSGEQPKMIVNTIVKFKGAGAPAAGEKLVNGFSTEFYAQGGWVDVQAYNPIQDASLPYFTNDYATGDGTLPGGDGVGHRARCRIIGDSLELDGYCISGDPPASQIFKLPAAMRPKYDKRVPVALDLNDDSPDAFVSPAMLRIKASGEVHLLTSYTATGVVVSLCGIKVRIK